MLRVAIVGCGKIADQHVEHIAYAPDCRIVAVCDREDLMALQLQERLGIQHRYTEIRELLEQSRPDVVHITTPPQTHYKIARQCLEAGSHIYVEKPFTMDVAEAEGIIALARARNLKLTVGHNAQFSPSALKMREIAGSGYLGGKPVHLESYYCYDLSDPGYAKALLGDPYHWVRTLPGALLQNTISHGISKVAEFLEGDDPYVSAYGYTSSVLRSIGEAEIVDELRVTIHDGVTSAYFTFSSQMRPSLHQLRIYGPKNGLLLDETQQTVIRLMGSRHKSYLEQFLPPWNFARQYVANSVGNIRKFLRADFHSGYGMRCLIQRFYDSVQSGGEPPIPYREILLTAQIMDRIFDQLGRSRVARERAHQNAALPQHN